MGTAKIFQIDPLLTRLLNGSFIANRITHYSSVSFTFSHVSLFSSGSVVVHSQVETREAVDIGRLLDGLKLAVAGDNSSMYHVDVDSIRRDDGMRFRRNSNPQATTPPPGSRTPWARRAAVAT